MKKILIVSSLFLLVTPAHAYNPIVAEPPQVYEVIPVEGDPYVQREYLGDLADFPDMYELTTDMAITLDIRVRQLDTDKAVPFGLMLIRQNDDDGGVTEVERKNQPVTEWTEIRESSLGMDFLESSYISREVPKGIYRIEVSTPDNRGEYMLIIGDEPKNTSFFKAFSQIYLTQRHFGYTPLHIFFSSYIYYPLGIILVLSGIYRTWRYRHQLRYA